MPPAPLNIACWAWAFCWPVCFYTSWDIWPSLCGSAGVAERLIITPLGGLSLPHVPAEPYRELLVALAGPAVNFFIMMLVRRRW